MRTFLRILLSFTAGLVLTYIAAVAAMFAYMSASNVLDRDGGMSMGIPFGIGPLCGIVGGIAAAIAIPIRLNRRDMDRQLDRAATGTPNKRWPPHLRAAVAAVAWGAAAYLLGRLMFWLFVAGTSFTSYWAALAAGLAPLLFGLAVALLAGLLVLRGARGGA